MKTDKKKIWLREESFYVTDEQMEVINTKGVFEADAYEFVTTGKKNENVQRAIEKAEKEKAQAPAAPASSQNIEQMIEAGVEKAMSRILSDYEEKARRASEHKK
jgi:hypothetical protein